MVSSALAIASNEDEKGLSFLSAFVFIFVLVRETVTSFKSCFRYFKGISSTYIGCRVTLGSGSTTNSSSRALILVDCLLISGITSTPRSGTKSGSEVMSIFSLFPAVCLEIVHSPMIFSPTLLVSIFLGDTIRFGEVFFFFCVCLPTDCTCSVFSLSFS